MDYDGFIDEAAIIFDQVGQTSRLTIESVLLRCDSETGSGADWSAASGPVSLILEADFIQAAWSGDSQQLALVSSLGVQVYQVRTLQPVWFLDADVRSAAFSPDGKLLALGKGDGTVDLWDVTERQVVLTLHAHTYSVQSLAFSTDGTLLASVSQSEADTVKIWDIAAGSEVLALSKAFSIMAWSPDWKRLALAECARSETHTTITGPFHVCTQGRITLWDVSADKPVGEPLLSHNYEVGDVAFSPDGRLLATGSCGQGQVDLGGNRYRLFPQHLCNVGEIILWDVASMHKVRTLTGHIDRIASLAFSPDGRLLATGSCGTKDPPGFFYPACIQGEIIVWDVSTGHQRDVFPGHTAGVSSLVFSPDGKLLVSVGNDNSVILRGISLQTSYLTSSP
jgi:WD40 repeat protein